jgi:hypothetical protein
MQTELLNRKRWRTRLELANAIFEYVEIFHNRKRRHSALGMLTTNEYKTLYHQQQKPPNSPQTQSNKTGPDHHPRSSPNMRILGKAPYLYRNAV